VASDVAWVAETNLHVTLKFLGQIDDARVPSLVSALAAAAAGLTGFEVGVRGLGAFPSATRPRVVWAGLDAPQLTALANAVDAALASLGFPRESRPFSAHVTLGRVRESRRPNRALAAALGRPVDFGFLAVSHVSLMRSELSPRGARYTELAAAPLGARAVCQ
jgi:RNA 2',3'-cyclic 3'-phosphodiesterase